MVSVAESGGASHIDALVGRFPIASPTPTDNPLDAPNACKTRQERSVGTVREVATPKEPRASSAIER